MRSSPADCFQCRAMPLGGWSSLMVKMVRQKKRRRWCSFRVRTPVVWNWPEVPKGRETGHPCVCWRPSSFSIFGCRVWDREALWIGIDEQFSCDRGECDGSEYWMAPDVVFECAGRVVGCSMVGYVSGAIRCYFMKKLWSRGFRVFKVFEM